MRDTEIANNYNTSNPSTNSMAAQGRGGDSMMAHVTPGDYVIPKDILVENPEFLVKLKKIMGDKNVDYRTHMVGSGFENINPQTGAPEFFGGFGSALKKVARTVGGVVGRAEGKLLPESISRPIGQLTSQFAENIPIPGLSSAQQGYAAGIGYNPSNLASKSSTSSITPMSLPGSLSELSGLTDQQQRSYLASQGAQGGGLGGNARDYYLNLLQRNIASDQGALLPVESQYLGSQGINTALTGRSLIDALSGI